MWPRSLPAKHILRIGRHRLEHWLTSERDLVLQSAHAAPASHLPSLLDWREALNGLSNLSSAQTTIIVDSYWIPGVLVPVQPHAWQTQTVMAILRHRLDLSYGDTQGTGPWELRSGYRIGDTYSLGWGVKANWLQTLTQACVMSGLRLTGLLPTLAWGLDRLLAQRRWRRGTGWFLWPEQDRWQALRLLNGNPVAFHAAVSPDSASELELLADMHAEAHRQGVGSDEPMVAAYWPNAVQPTAVEGLTWANLREAARHRLNVRQWEGLRR